MLVKLFSEIRSSLIHLLGVNDFIAENIELFSSLDYDNLHGHPAPTKVGKLGVKLLTGGAEPTHCATRYGILCCCATSLSYARKQRSSARRRR